MTAFPDEPDIVNVVKVFVVPAVHKNECAADPSLLKSAKTFEPVIVFAAVLAPRANQTLWYVFPAPANVIAVAEVSVILIVPVLAVKVMLAISNTVPVPVRMSVLPVPSVSVGVMGKLVDTADAVMVLFPVDRPPPVKVIPFVEVNASANE